MTTLEPLTHAQGEALGILEANGGWMTMRDICNARGQFVLWRTINALVEKGYVEKHHASGGPNEYRAKQLPLALDDD